MSDAVIIQIIQVVGLVVVAIVGGKKLRTIGADAKEARDQTANSHADADYPNLRADLDAKFEGLSKDIGNLRGEVGLVRGDLRGVRKDVVGLHQEDAQLRDELALTVSERDRRLASLSRSIPGVVAELIADKFQEWTRPKEGDDG